MNPPPHSCARSAIPLVVVSQVYNRSDPHSNFPCLVKRSKAGSTGSSLHPWVSLPCPTLPYSLLPNSSTPLLKAAQYLAW